MNNNRKSAAPKSTNQKSKLLNEEENKQLFSIIGLKRTTLATAVAQLVTADPPNYDRWIKKCCGVATFIKDFIQRTYFICLYDLKSGQCLWSQELYINFQYHAPQDFFHQFEAHDCPAGLNFANEDEAEFFRKTVQEKIRERQERRDSNTLTKHKNSVNTGHSSSPVANRVSVGGPPPTNVRASVTPAPAYNQPSTSATGTIKGKKDANKKKPLSKEDISNPTNFKHVQHMGWDSNGTVQNTAIDLNDPDLRQLFERMNMNVNQFSKDDLGFVNEFVKQRGGMDAVRNDNKRYGRPLPPPPVAAAPAPPTPRSLPPVPPTPAPAAQAPAPPPPPRTQPAPAPPPQRPPSQPMSRPPPGQPQPEAPTGPPPRARPAAPSVPAPVRPRAAPPSRPPPGPPPAPPSAAPVFQSPRAGVFMPPPPPPAAPAPPPPPPPPAFTPAAAADDDDDDDGDDTGRSDLLASIRAGTKLKTAEQQAPAAPIDARSNLLSDIVNRGAKNLRTVTIEPVAKQETNEDTGLAGALARALMARQKNMTGDDEDEDNSDASEDDDDEWND